jgi:diguanylate cyclase (GGDEF)-like protein
MKVGRSEGPGRAQRVTGAYAKAVPAPVAEAAPVSAAAPISPSTYGIPEGEFTPRVRDAIATLLHEVSRLRREVDQAKARLEDVAKTADQDMLLPVLNRRAFVREVHRFISFAERYSTPSCLIYFDLDDFKSVNDAHGHAAGDAVLAQFAETILGQVRDSDVVARLGGDEFGVILAHVTREQALKKAANLASALKARPARWRGTTLPMEFSYGVHELQPGESVDAAMAHADRAMYAQKKKGIVSSE